MKNTLNSLVTPVLALLAVAAIAGASQDKSSGSCCAPLMAMQAGGETIKPVPAKDVKGVQKLSITIEGGKYSPSVISVIKGKPVELTFKGGKNMGCGSTVVFKSLKQSKDIPAGKSAVIKFTPKEVGTIEFTCGMGMYDGKVIVK